MNEFTFSYPTKVYFGQDSLEKALQMELDKYGKTVMLAYGGASLKKNGIYDRVRGVLKKAGKDVVDFPGIMPNPTYAKVQEGAALAKEKGVDFILAVGGWLCHRLLQDCSGTGKDRYGHMGNGVFGRQISHGVSADGCGGYSLRHRGRAELRRRHYQ